MAPECEEYVKKYVRLREELKPVEIYMGDPPEPIDPEWVGITRSTFPSLSRDDVFNLCFFMDDGQCLTWEQFETLQIALDQAKAIVGIRHDEWRDCRVKVEEGGRVLWSKLA